MSYISEQEANQTGVWNRIELRRELLWQIMARKGE